MNKNKNDSKFKYYEILGIDKNSTSDEIRKSYRKLAASLHPDKGGDQGKFQELQNAYEILSDPKKREVYDEYGEDGLREGMASNDDFDPFDSRNEFNNDQKCKLRVITLKITLEEVFYGSSKILEYARRILCSICNGTGLENPNICKYCQGKGKIIYIKKIRNIEIKTENKCDNCNGFINICKECLGEKVIYNISNVTVDIPKGIQDGHVFPFIEQGDEYPNVKTGDLYVNIFIESHKNFILNGNDLIHIANISILDALTGVTIYLTHINGKKLKLISDKIIHPNMCKIVYGKGMPIYGMPYSFGNLIINFEIEFPDKLDKLEILELRRIFNVHPSIKNDSFYYTLEEYNYNDENTNCKGGKLPEEIEESRYIDNNDMEETINLETNNCVVQ